MELLTRKDALSIGAKHYFTGKPCKHGHVVERNTKRGYCVECHNKRALSYFHKKRAERDPAWDAKRKESCRRYQAKRKADPIKLAADNRRRALHSKTNRTKMNAYAKAYRRRKEAETGISYNFWYSNRNPQYRIAKLLRCRINMALKKRYCSKAYASTELLGCSINQAIDWLESQFLPGMSWENHGKWHIDHIRPCASFNLEDSEQQKQCFHYTNLQPLWAKDNLAKSDNWEPEAV